MNTTFIVVYITMICVYMSVEVVVILHDAGGSPDTGVFRVYLYRISKAEDTPCSAMSVGTSIAWSWRLPPGDRSNQEMSSGATSEAMRTLFISVVDGVLTQNSMDQRARERRLGVKGAV